MPTKDALPDEPHPREPDEIDAERESQSSEEEKLELAPTFPAAIGAPDHTPHHAPLHWLAALPFVRMDAPRRQ